MPTTQAKIQYASYILIPGTIENTIMLSNNIEAATHNYNRYIIIDIIIITTLLLSYNNNNNNNNNNIIDRYITLLHSSDIHIISNN